MRNTFEDVVVAVHVLVGDDVDDWEFSSLVDVAERRTPN